MHYACGAFSSLAAISMNQTIRAAYLIYVQCAAHKQRDNVLVNLLPEEEKKELQSDSVDSAIMLISLC